ncbi:MAG TPA: hypothetical protein VNR38_08105 [Ureibacillus sp.]|nr:hypothetical protein [Ureibacillus sp.]
MNKYFISFAFIFFGLCMVFSAFYISEALKEIAYSQKGDTTTVTEVPSEWELIVVNENNIILFNNITGEYWRKFIESNEGPTEWEKGNNIP